MQHRVARVSFYLLHRSDDVDVYVIDQSGNIVDTVASGRHMRRGVRNPDGEFAWNGRLSDGSVAPAGTYYFRVSLIHQGRTVVISNPSGPEPITVLSTPPAPSVTSVSPRFVPQAGRLSTTITLTGDDRRGGFVNLYRVTKRPRLAKTFGLPWGVRRVIWDGMIGGRRAPAGTYFVGLTMTDAACVTRRFPSRLPPSPAALARAQVTVRSG
jgi:FlgD Ig-like domain